MFKMVPIIVERRVDTDGATGADLLRFAFRFFAAIAGPLLGRVSRSDA